MLAEDRVPSDADTAAAETAPAETAEAEQPQQKMVIRITRSAA